MRNVKYLIIGAGVSGLTFANYIKSDYLIVEKENEIGGYCKTHYKDGFVWDYAGHFFHFKTDEFKKMFINRVNKSEIIKQDKCTKIFYHANYIDYPFQTNIHQLEKSEFIDCLYDLFNKEEKKEYDNFLDMLYGKFGKSITEKFLRPYNEKLYAIDLRKLDKDAMGRFFPYADIKDIIYNMKKNSTLSYNNQFLYPRHGAGAFMKILFDNLSSDNVILNTEVISIDSKKKVALLSNNEEIKYEYLINTSPLNKFLSIIDNNKYYELSSQLSYNKVLVFNLGFDKKSKLTSEHWIYVPEKKYNFYRIGFYDNILGTDRLSMYIEIGYSKDEKIKIDEQLRLTLLNLKEIGVIDDSMNLLSYESIIMDPAYVHINNDTDKKIKKFMRVINKKSIYSIGRYGAWTYCSMEDCMVNAKELAETLEK